MHVGLQEDMHWAAEGRALGCRRTCIRLCNLVLHLTEGFQAREQRPCPEEDSKPHLRVFSPQVTNPLPEGWEEQRNQPSFGLCSKQPYAPQHPISETSTGMPGRGHLS